MALTFYDLEYADGRRYSPFCWRTRLALAHKGLEAAVVPVRITDKETISFAGSKTVPVLVDGETTVADSWRIACHLEDAYPDRPSLFGGDIGRHYCRFINSWTDTVLLRAMFPVVGPELLASFLPADQEYFRPSREKREGMTFEEMKEQRPALLERLYQVLPPLRTTLSQQPYLSGEAPAYADFIVMAVLQWARCASPAPTVLPEDTPLYEWRERMLDAFDGLARSMPAHPDAR